MSFIAESTIDRIKEAANIEEVVGEFITLKQKGANLTACCPFHGEKTPSFSVSRTRNIFVCFGCGKKGDAITFLMEHEKLSYPEALQYLAKKYNIEIEEVKGKDAELERKANDDYAAVTRGALGHYVKQLHERPALVEQLLNERQIKKETLIDFQLGYAPDDWKFLTPSIIKAGYYQAAAAVGIIATKGEENFDFFRNRIIIPIINRREVCIGFGARKFEDGNKENPKYLNSKECKGFFDKSRTLFGINLAFKAIKEEEFAYLVEGYFDVMQFHDKGLRNTVAAMGTAFTDEHAHTIASITKSVILAMDGDVAGRNATFKSIDKLLAQGVECLYLPMFDGYDPDTMPALLEFLTYDTYNGKPSATRAELLQQYCMTVHIDAVMWKIDSIIQDAKSVTQKAVAIDTITELLALIKADTVRNEYIAYCKKKHDLKIVIRKSEEVRDLSDKEVNQKLAHLRWLTKEKKEQAFFVDGFTICEEPNDFGYWFGSPGFNIERMTNFILKPLFSVNEPDEKFELVEVCNRYGSTVLEVPIGGFTSMDKFEGLIWQARAVLMGKFGRDHLRMLNSKYIFQFKQATLVRTLGMQPEGFWSYADALFYKGELLRYDEMGIAGVDNQTFYSPGAGTHNRGKRKNEFGDEVKEGDPYRNDKYLSYRYSTNVNFSKWSKQMMLVFGQKGMNAIATVILAIFKDIVASFEKVPIPYGYGDAESGKSAWAERIFYFFFDRELKPYNLNSGTVFSFFNTMERFKNCPYVFNEFDEDNIMEEFFRAFKQAFDGEGRNKGLMGSSVRNKSVEQPINVLPILIGQILTTKDGGSVLTRCVPEKFIGRVYTDEEKANLDVLVKWEKEGLNHCICELLPHRGDFRKNFFPNFNQVLSTLKADINKEGLPYKERIARNHAIMLTCAKMMLDNFDLGFQYKDYYSYMLGSVINLTQMVNESNNLGVFWRELMFMFEQQLIEEGFDYRIINVGDIDVSVMEEGRKVTRNKKFEGTKKLLLLRLTSIFPLFEQRVKSSTGNKAINQKTLITYFESNKAYIGNNPGQKFKSTKKNITQTTSSFVFEYDLLGLNLEREVGGEETALETFIGKIIKDPERLDVAGTDVLKFTTVHYIQEGLPLKTLTIYTNCFLPVTSDPGIKAEDTVTVKGNLTISEGFQKRPRRNMDVTEISIGNPAGDDTKPENPSGDAVPNDELPF